MLTGSPRPTVVGPGMIWGCAEGGWLEVSIAITLPRNLLVFGAAHRKHLAALCLRHKEVDGIGQRLEVGVICSLGQLRRCERRC